MALAALIAILVISSGACSESSAVTAFPTSPSPPLAPRPAGLPLPPIPGGLYAISGVITEHGPQGGRPLPGVSVNAWVQTATIGYAYMFAYGPRVTDAEGRYELAGIPPGARVRLQAFAQGYVQQCAPPEVHANLSLRLDAALVPRASVSAAPASVPPPAPGFRQVTGTVYEVTAQGRRPVADAFVDYEPIDSFPAAITYADGQGRFLLCGIPEEGDAWIAAANASGRFASVRVPPGTHTSVDIEIR